MYDNMTEDYILTGNLFEDIPKINLAFRNFPPTPSEVFNLTNISNKNKVIELLLLADHYMVHKTYHLIMPDT